MKCDFGTGLIPWLRRALLALALGVALASVGAGAGAEPPRLARFQVNGREYVSAEEWARANGGLLSWVIPKQEFRVSLPSGSLSFVVDSRKALIKGVRVHLSYAVALRGGTPCLASRDLSTTVHPLLNPVRYPSPRPVRTIVLDPGHGGRDPGNKEGSRLEKTYTLLFAKELAALLEKAGFSVSLTRTADTYPDLPVRPDLARRRNADLFVSIHFNSYDGPGASAVKGVETYCMTPVLASSTNARGEGEGTGAFPGNRLDARNLQLAYQIQKALTGKTGAEDRGVKRARFWVLRNAEMPAVLIEGGYMTSPFDSRRIYDPAQRRVAQQAIVDGILAYQRQVSPAPGSPPPPPPPRGRLQSTTAPKPTPAQRHLNRARPTSRSTSGPS